MEKQTSTRYYKRKLTTLNLLSVLTQVLRLYSLLYYVSSTLVPNAIAASCSIVVTSSLLHWLDQVHHITSRTMAEANTKPMETAEEVLLRSEHGQTSAPTEGTSETNTTHARRLSRRVVRSAVMESGRVLKRSAKNQNFSIIRCFSWILFVTTACLYQQPNDVVD